jgi:hypothetical protein
MASTLIRHIRSNVIAYLALFVALGGTSYAAIRLPADSVGNRQIKNSAVTSGKVRNGTLRGQDFAAGTLRRGVRGPEGPAGSLADGLPSGKTLRGRFEAGDGSPPNAVNDVASEAISFGAQLAAAPPRTIVLNPPGPAQCPGTVADPQAAPGQFCIYVGDRTGIASVDTLIDGGAVGGTTRQGAGIFVISNTTGVFGARGSWAVTAP